MRFQTERNCRVQHAMLGQPRPWHLFNDRPAERATLPPPLRKEQDAKMQKILRRTGF